LRANMVENISEYPYSSYNYYAKGRKDDIITTNAIYNELAISPRERQKNYIEYVNQGRPYEHIVDKALEMCPQRT